MSLWKRRIINFSVGINAHEQSMVNVGFHCHENKQSCKNIYAYKSINAFYIDFEFTFFDFIRLQFTLRHYRVDYFSTRTMPAIFPEGGGKYHVIRDD